MRQGCNKGLTGNYFKWTRALFCGAFVPLIAEAEPEAKVNLIMCGSDPSTTVNFLCFVLGIAILAGACVVVAKSRRPAMIAAYFAFVPIPLIVAVIAVIKSTIAGFSIAVLSDTTLPQTEIFAGLAESLLVVLVGLLATIPAYLVIAVGLFVRTLQVGRHQHQH